MPFSIHSTGDVPLDVLEEFNEGLPHELRGHVDPRQTMLRSADPPSWITFLADAPWWVQVFTAWSALYFAEIAKEAGKDTWKNRSRLSDIARRGGGGLLAGFPQAVSALRARVRSPTQFRLGLPIPDDYFSTTFELNSLSPEDIAADLLLFYLHLPQLRNVIIDHDLASSVVAGVILTLRDDGSMEVAWMDQSTLQPTHVVLQIPDHAV
jgi:hypothetical protein